MGQTLPLNMGATQLADAQTASELIHQICETIAEKNRRA
jgi:hypothetical protein